MDLGIELGKDPTKETEGVWVDLDDETSVKLGYAGGPKFQNELGKQVRRMQMSRRVRVMDMERDRAVRIHAFANQIVLDWKGMKEHGTDIPYSRQEAVRVMNDYPEFMDWVEMQSMMIENFRMEGLEEAEKN